VTTRTAARAPRLDQVCADAVGVARGAITEVDPADIGEHLEAVAEGDRVVTHFFESHLAGYRGWRWAVTVTRVPRSRHVTVCETVLLPGPDALLAPSWVPWNERLQPGDLGVGDLMPTAPDDDRLTQGYVLSDDAAVEEVSWELGLGRSRVMSREGRIDTAQRWYDGDSGPISLHLVLGAADSVPPNDSFANRITLTGPSITLTASNKGATKEAGEPNHGGNIGGKSIWYTWTAPTSGKLTIDTAGSNFDTLLGVYTGTSVSALTLAASNDDVSSLDHTSYLSFNAIAGQTYHIRIDGYNGAQGSIVMTLS